MHSVVLVCWHCPQAPFLLELRSKSTLSRCWHKGYHCVIRLPGHAFPGYHISWVMGPRGMFQPTFFEPLGFHLSNTDVGIRSGMSWQALPTDTLHGLTHFLLSWTDSCLLTTGSLRIRSSTQKNSPKQLCSQWLIGSFWQFPFLTSLQSSVSLSYESGRKSYALSTVVGTSPVPRHPFTSSRDPLMQVWGSECKNRKLIKMFIA